MAEAALNAQDAFPSITCNDVDESIRFYIALGFEVVHKMEDDEGKVQFASLKAGGVTVGLGQDDFAKGHDRVKGVGLRIWINTTQDVTGVAALASAAGVKIDEGPKALPWGPMAFAVTDPDGFKITVTNPMVD
jgi:uncharacterized glyoxalase superfamily protein PhnB